MAPTTPYLSEGMMQGFYRHAKDRQDGTGRQSYFAGQEYHKAWLVLWYQPGLVQFIDKNRRRNPYRPVQLFIENRGRNPAASPPL